MQREVMLIKALSVYSITPPASAFKLVQSLVASITHYADVKDIVSIFNRQPVDD